MKKTILVLGATGKSGRRLIPKLINQGASVRAASRKAHPERIRFDWNDEATHGPTLAGVDAIYLVPPDFVDDATPVVRPFLERARAAGVSQVVAVTSLGVEFPTEPVDSGRRKLEAAVRDSGMAWTILRPGGFAQNFSEGFMLPGILHMNAIVGATGDGAVAYVDADDIASVAAAAFAGKAPAKTELAITGPQALSLGEIAEVISRAAGRPIVYRTIGLDEMANILRGGGVPEGYAPIVLRDMQAIRDGYGARVSDTVQRQTGRAPITFATYATNAAAAWTLA